MGCDRAHFYFTYRGVTNGSSPLIELNNLKTISYENFTT